MNELEKRSIKGTVVLCRSFPLQSKLCQEIPIKTRQLCREHQGRGIRTPGPLTAFLPGQKPVTLSDSAGEVPGGMQKGGCFVENPKPLL